jgi:hypothetical protein
MFFQNGIKYVVFFLVFKEGKGTYVLVGFGLPRVIKELQNFQTFFLFWFFLVCGRVFISCSFMKKIQVLKKNEAFFFGFLLGLWLPEKKNSYYKK